MKDFLKKNPNLSTYMIMLEREAMTLANNITERGKILKNILGT